MRPFLYYVRISMFEAITDPESAAAIEAPDGGGPDAENLALRVLGADADGAED
jgi:hypothetical protein